jgi:hypothetical protein
MMKTINLTPNYETLYAWAAQNLRMALNGIRSESDRDSARAMLDVIDEIAVPAIKTAAPIWKEKEE